MSGLPTVLEQHRDLGDLAVRQHGIVTRRQLAGLGVTRDHLRRHLAARRWRTIGGVVVVLHCGPLDREALLRVAVLNAHETEAALAAWTALEWRGLTGWLRDPVHVLIRRGTTPAPRAGVILHESRRFDPDADAGERQALRCVSAERAAIDAGSWSRDARSATALILAAVRQRLTTPARLREVLDHAGRIRYRRVLASAIDHAEGGADALSEVDLGPILADAGLPSPVRQAVRVDRRGRRRYLDVRVALPDGTWLAVEVDGPSHLEELTYWDDMARQNELVISGDHVLRFPVIALRVDRARVVDQLRAVQRAAAVRAADGLSVAARRQAAR